MKQKLLLTTLFMLMGLSMAIAKVVEVGAPSSHSFLPASSWQPFSISQQIYNGSELGEVDIRCLSFFNEGYSATRTLDIYLVSTTKKTFKISDSNRSRDWIQFSEEDKVFSGTVNFRHNEWTMLVLNKPFLFDWFSHANQNLAVITVDRTGSSYSAMKCRTAPATDQAIYFLSNYGEIEIGSLFSYNGTVVGEKNWIRINTQPEDLMIGPLKNYIDFELPTTFSLNYALTQQLYTKEEISMGGKIDGIAFQMVSGTAHPRSVDVYLAETSMSDLGSGWLSCDETQKVFSGSIPFVQGWTMIHFDKPYEYTGANNLVVTINDHSSNYTDSPTPLFVVMDAPQQSRTIRSGTEFNPASPPVGSGVLLDMKCCARFSFMKDHDDGVIGDGFTESANLPSNSGSKYFLSEQIYTKEELGEAKAITSLSFFNTSDATQTRDLDIYMVHTKKQSYNRGNQWTVVTKADRVFRGKVTFEKGAWTPIPFARAFEYNGEDNVAIIVDDNSNESQQYGNWYLQCLSFYAPGQAIYKNSQENNYDPTTFSSDSEGNLMDMKNQIKLNEKEIDNSPRELQVLDYDAHNVMLSWRDVVDATKWELGFWDWDIWGVSNVVEVNHIPYTLSGLEPNTEYAVLVRSVIDEEKEIYSDWGFVSCTTCEPDNPVPSNIKVETSPTTADISWHGKGDSYNVSYKKAIFCDNFDYEPDYIPTASLGWTAYIGDEGDSSMGGWFLTDYGLAAFSDYDGTAIHADN